MIGITRQRVLVDQLGEVLCLVEERDPDVARRVVHVLDAGPRDQRAAHLRQRALDEPVVEALVDEHPLDARADLARVGHAAPEHGLQRALDHRLIERGAGIAHAGFGAEVRRAMDARTDHLVKEGLARRFGERTVFERGMLDTLRASPFVRKESVQFVTGTGKLSEPFYFADYKPGENSRTWQVSRAEFDQQLKQSPYFSFLPDDAKPDLNLNKEMMERYRPEMTKFYLNKKANFK